MKEVTLIINCDCGFQKQRVFYTNEYGYFEISTAYCPNCFNILMYEIQSGPIDIIKNETQTELELLTLCGYHRMKQKRN